MITNQNLKPVLDSILCQAVIYLKLFKDNVWVVSPTFKLESRWEMVGLDEDHVDDGDVNYLRMMLVVSREDARGRCLKRATGVLGESVGILCSGRMLGRWRK